MASPDPCRLIEALLFAGERPLSERELAERLEPGIELAPLLERLRRDYEGRGVSLVKRGDGWAFRTAADLGPWLRVETERARRPSRAMIETLAVIAYHQPCTRAEIEDIRGVALSKGTLDLLFEAGWIRPAGRKKTPGRPMLWATTDAFLDHFGLEGLESLPGLEELKESGLLDLRPGFSSYANRAEKTGDDEEEEDGNGLFPSGV